MDDLDREILIRLQDDIPLVSRPFRVVAEGLGIDEGEVIERIRRMKEEGIVRRLSASLRHRKLGIGANALCIWKVPEERVEEVGRRMASFEEVTHCYERPIVPGKWEYNLFTMVHGYDRESVEAIIERIAKAVGIQDYRRLYSTREFKKVYRQYSG
jgi:DNA-binding Lrp family transcriptional regulator